MFNKNNIIKFISINDYYHNVAEDIPSPATKFVPEWWKKMETYAGGKLKTRGPYSSATGKKCMPMLDAMTCGYIIPLWSDVLVSNENGNKNITWRTDEAVIGSHDTRQSGGVEVPEGYIDIAYKYHLPWVIKTPPGWSTLFTHPIGYKNLPFQMISGLVDTDIYPQDINPVFWLKENFEGVIEKGTPMVQVIPIKRESWKSEHLNSKENEHYYNQQKNLGRHMINNYIRNVWKKKEYK